MKQHETLSLKTQYILGCLVIVVVPVFILAIYFFRSNIVNMRKTYINNRASAVSQIAASVDDRVIWIDAMVNQIFLNQNLTSLLRRSKEEVKYYDEEYRSVYNGIKNIYIATPFSDSIKAILLSGDNGLDIRYGEGSALITMDKIIDSEWYQSGKIKNRFNWGTYGETYNEYTKKVYVVPVYFPMIASLSGSIVGDGILLFNSSIFEGCYKNLIGDKNEYFYLVNENEGIISTNQVDENGALLQVPQGIADIISNVVEKTKNSSSTLDVSYEIVKNIENIGNNQKGSFLITYKRSSVNKWITIEILPMTQIAVQTNNLLKTLVIIIVLSIILCFVLSIFVSHILIKPIGIMVNSVQDIGQGQFHKINISKSAREVNILAGSINKMQENISELMNENIEKEKEKYTLEMQMLQSQINPHFLYNTLNTIRLMAVMQGSNGIVKMIHSLSDILKYSLNAIHQKTKLSDEIKIINDYIHIQNIRYKGCIGYEVHLEDDQINNCEVPRFIVQPIVENAIMHGLVTKSEDGLLILSAYCKEEKLYIEIFDNGLGISTERLSQIRNKLSEGIEKNVSSNGGIGVYNVHRRIQLLYGKEYGICIESEKDNYTKVKIVLKRSDYYGKN